ncbi:MAG: hypothetical protein ACRDS0_32185 [Pseudonocardiaceae bacterium]
MIAHSAVRRRFALAMVAAVTTLVPTACAYEGLGVDKYAAFGVRGDGSIAAASPATAITYNPALAPVGGQMKATMTPSGETTIADLTVSGLVPNRSYSVVAHVNTCGGVPGGEGPRFQDHIDPAAAASGKPSTNPEYSSATNEIWLDVHTDASGSGTSHATVPFVFTDRGPGSLVVHDQAETTATSGQGGQTSDRVACLTLTATPYGA